METCFTSPVVAVAVADDGAVVGIVEHPNILLTACNTAMVRPLREINIHVYIYMAGKEHRLSVNGQ
jgi:hypothetical protein